MTSSDTKMPLEPAISSNPNALAFDDGVDQIKYGDLGDAISRSWLMRLRSIRPGDQIAWSPRNDAESFLTFWALRERGCVCCPISHRFPESSRMQMLRRIDARWLPELSETDEPQPLSVPEQTESKQPATIILSSGSTGLPKAVVHTMSAHIASAEGAATNMPLASGDRWLWSLPLFHISGLSILVRCAVAAATVVGTRAAGKLTAELLDERQVTHVSLVNTQLRRLLREDIFPSPHLKYVLLGGSSVDPQLVTAARERGVKVCTTYGLTETASQVTTSTPTDAPNKSGRLLPHREMKIAASGEIFVRGETLCLGYYENGAVRPVIDEDGWFHTRDIGSLDAESQLSVTGRIDNMFISGGENIHPETIERDMMRLFDIEQAVVVPRPDKEFGVRPVAFVEGQLPANWQSRLQDTLKSFEIPVEILPWPDEAMGSIKADRKYLQRLMN